MKAFSLSLGGRLLSEETSVFAGSRMSATGNQTRNPKPNVATFGFGFLVWFPVALIRDPANTEVSSLSSLPPKDKLKAFMGLSLQIGLASYGLLLALIVLMRLG